jgi:4-aminobutyrate aminotransferase
MRGAARYVVPCVSTPRLVVARAEGRRQKPPRAAATAAAARKRGLVLLTCGPYGNVIRILASLVIADEVAGPRLEILDALGESAAA